MRWLVFVSLVLVLVALWACPADARSRKLRSSSNRKTDFDFFFLVRQWPATFCNDHHCTHRPPSKYAFTVHGMWPQRRDGTWPEYCNPSDHLRMDEVDDLLDDLEKQWPSWSSADEVFWDHEWSRHGTCAAPITGPQHRFFQTVLSLHEKFNIQDALRAAGITPSNSHRYPVQDIKDAIEQRYGVMPHVTCDGQGALSEVWMCINKKLRVIDCVEDPRPPHANSGPGATQQLEAGADEATSAPVPPNYNCKTVTIPKLQRHWGRLPDLAGLQPDSSAQQQLADSPELADDDGMGDDHHEHYSQHHRGHAHSAAAQHVSDDDSQAQQQAAGATAPSLFAEVAALLTGVAEPLIEAVAGAGREEAAAGSNDPVFAVEAADPVEAAEAADASELASAVAEGSVVAQIPDVAEVVDVPEGVEVSEAAVAAEAAEAAAGLVTALAAVEQATVAVAKSVAEAVVATTATAGGTAAAGVTVGAEVAVSGLEQPAAAQAVVAAAEPQLGVAAQGGAAAASAPQESLEQLDTQKAALPSPNAQLPLLGCVVVAIVAAAILAAAVAMGAQPCAGEEGEACSSKSKACKYVPPVVCPQDAAAAEAMPLLSAPDSV